MVELPSSVTITQPHHPLQGHKLEVVSAPRRANSKILVRLPEGKCIRVPRDWTDFEAQQSRHTEAPVAHLLDIKGLLKAAKIISSIKAE
jgi:hypothetical protein